MACPPCPLLENYTDQRFCPSLRPTARLGNWEPPWQYGDSCSKQRHHKTVFWMRVELTTSSFKAIIKKTVEKCYLFQFFTFKLICHKLLLNSLLGVKSLLHLLQSLMSLKGYPGLGGWVVTVQIHFLSISYFSSRCWEKFCWKPNLYRCIFFLLGVCMGLSAMLSKNGLGSGSY